MKKRLRRKRRVGEFQELGFRLRVKTRQPLSRAHQDTLLDALIEQVEKHDLIIDGGIGSNEGDFFITTAHRGSATDEHRQLLTQWLEQQPAVATATADPLQDAWY